jgi:uncharacterized protein YjeT (DUF2065 family)
VVTFVAGVVVLLAALYLLGFGALALLLPARASGYLHGFAASLRVHLLELVARAAVGLALVGYASHMRYAGAFHLFGLILVFTTLALALVPWRWHHRFSQASVPAVQAYLPVIGVVSIASGSLMIWAVASMLVG